MEIPDGPVLLSSLQDTDRVWTVPRGNTSNAAPGDGLALCNYTDGRSNFLIAI